MNMHYKNSKLQHEGSLKQGVSISPLVVPLVIRMAYGTVMLFQGDLGGAFAMFFLCLMFGLPFTYTITFTLVLPMAIFLRNINALSSARLCLWCTLLAPVTFYAYIYLLNGGPERMPDLYGIIFSLLCGFISGVAFCLIARIRVFAN
jgi:hypothetical protein